MSDDDARAGRGPGGRRSGGDRAAPTVPLTLQKDAAPGPGTGGDLEQDTSASAYTPGGDDGGRAGRFWSTRRLPATVVAAVLLAATGLLLYDVVVVRLGGPGMAWRRTLAEEFATRPLDDVWVRVGAAVAVVLGLWLLTGALTPGLRGLLPMRRDTPDVRAGLERDAAALVLRDRAMEVAGVQGARVKVGRRRVRARAQAHFRELDEVRTELDSALGDGIRRLGVARRHRLSVRVRRPKR
ncbi:hypothetical protein N566_11020 [Streptomycetaceae bacterium MP113-05]|nr:hypothetical protein N566_11020 [Streptomycetaceae bacterium MP113-05]